MAEGVPVAQPQQREDALFDIVAHLVAVAPFREYPHAIVDEEKEVWLSVKQYIPRATTPSSHQDGALTIIAAGSLGIAKETYEPLFEEILRRTQQSGVAVRSIWIADMFNVGESAMANDGNLGCDPSWFDHSRDLWSVMGQFSSLMPKPIVGLGHSIGCAQLLCLSTWHPGLFHSFAFIEPGLDAQYGRGITIPWALRVLEQEDSFRTREDAEAAVVQANAAYAWDARVLARLKQYSVVQRPKAPGECDNIWVAATPKSQIASLVSRFNPNLATHGSGGYKPLTTDEREMVPDFDPSGFHLGPFYRRELALAWAMLPTMRPWVLYINGTNSPHFGRPETRTERARITGTGIGGNGGMKHGAVEQVVVEDGEHFMVYDRHMGVVADHVAAWLQTESRRWVDGPQKRRCSWLQTTEDKSRVSKDFKAALVSQMIKMKRAAKL